MSSVEVNLLRKSHPPNTPCEGGFDIHVRAVLEEWILTARAANLGPKTIDNYRLHVERFLRYLEGAGQFAEEIDQLLRACDLTTPLSVCDVAIVALLLDSGIRAMELITLLDRDVNTCAGVIKVSGKGAKERFVPVSARKLRAIRRYERRRDEFETFVLMTTSC